MISTKILGDVDSVELALSDSNSCTTCILYLTGYPSCLEMVGSGNISMYDYEFIVALLRNYCILFWFYCIVFNHSSTFVSSCN